MDQSRGWGAAAVVGVIASPPDVDCWPDCPDVDVDAEASDRDEAEDVRSAGSRGAFWATGA